jgi:SAM-dependent methyltransferase
MDYSFRRYLAAKQSVDDRSLNAHVWHTLQANLPPRPLDVLEIGTGTGAMIERLVARGMPGEGGRYTAIDVDQLLIDEARQRFAGRECPFSVKFVTADIEDFVNHEKGRWAWDLLVAHAVLDLLDVNRLLPGLFSLLRPEGFFYFTINFDGLTVLEPVIDPVFDRQVLELYHRTMDERVIAGRPSGHSRTGRHLLSAIPAAGGVILAAGSSDWIVLPGTGGYPGDEAYFLHHILHFFEASLAGRPELDQARLVGWLARRHAQIDAGELVYLAHQIDICGHVPGKGR